MPGAPSPTESDRLVTRSIDVRLFADHAGLTDVRAHEPPADLWRLLEQASVWTRPKPKRGRPVGTTTLTSIAEVMVHLDAARAAGLPLTPGWVAETMGVSEWTLARFLARYGLRFIAVDGRDSHPRASRP